MSTGQSGTLGKYQIIREIARSNDIVYEAYDPGMNRRVAVKELALPGGASAPVREDRIKRFMREAKAAGSLSHPNIVTIYEVGESDGRNFIAMEYLTGRNLREELDTAGLVDPKRAIDIALGVLSGLEHAHKQGVIHRDIKPDNIQLLEDGRVKVTDFGIARLTFEPNLTMDGQVFGTPSYMSPEQIHGREIDARSDLFSVGVVLYEMVSGQKPFQGDSVVSITYSILNRDPDPPSQCSPALWEVISTAINKSPQLRWAGAREMADQLRRAQNAVTNTSASALLGGPPPVGSARMPGPPPVIGQPMTQPYGSAPASGHVMPSSQPYGVIPSQQPYGVPPPAAPYGAPPRTGAYPFVMIPPPPKRPWMTPEQRLATRRFLLFVVVVGLIVAILVLGRAAIDNVVSNVRVSESGPTGAVPPPAVIPTPTPSSRPMPTEEPTWRQGIAEAQSELQLALAEWRPHAATEYVSRAEQKVAESVQLAGVETPAAYGEAAKLWLDLAAVWSQSEDRRWLALAKRATDNARTYALYDPALLARADQLTLALRPGTVLTPGS